MGIEKQLDYVKNNKEVLNSKYDGLYVVFSEEMEEKSFISLDEAYSFGVKKYGLGNFLLQQFSNQPNQVHIINQTITII